MRPETSQSATGGFSPRFTRACDHLLGIEGGYVNHKNDTGGATKYGISLRFLKAEGKLDANRDGFADFDLDFDGDIDGADIRKLTLDDARSLYWRCFWQAVGCERFPPPVGEMVFDQAVNGGALAAKKLLQRAINRCIAKTKPVAGVPRTLVPDGAIGTMTMDALTWVLHRPVLGTAALVEAYREEVKARYRAIVAANPSQGVFLKGWLRRADLLGRS